MNGTRNITAPARAAVAVEGDHSALIHDARQASRAFAAALTPAPGADATDNLLLVVSELVTNSLRHGGGRYTLALAADPDCMTVSVSDPSAELPHERTPDLGGIGGGFGWHMVNHLADRVTIVANPGSGKTVHARLLR
ncbi:ATP-binding protein [Streptomyces albipurpureus]|uniref:ATP-binding protein n=1 Tax=Streptomyces albipurpureus TaxID=2897419 RepID=A0ABT0UPP8_9ACTN|nr:ATP-binding protein [Streptomyces sp. CWNU-1]MCM2389575.1 ATP-binding protein [Streptomyces sp. CWNU-1]